MSGETDCTDSSWECGLNACQQPTGERGIAEHCTFSGFGTCQTADDCRCVCDDPPCDEAVPQQTLFTQCPLA